MKSLIHDTAWSTSLTVFESVEHLLPEEGRRAIFDAIYARIRAGLECYETHAERMRQRLGKN